MVSKQKISNYAANIVSPIQFVNQFLFILRIGVCLRVGGLGIPNFTDIIAKLSFISKYSDDCSTSVP